MSTELAESPKQTAITRTIDAGERGLVLGNLDEMWRFAGIVLKSGCAPKGIDRQETVFVALELGAELGLPPMASIQNIAVINGRPSLWGDAMLGLCQRSPQFDHRRFREWIDGDGDDRVAHCLAARIGAETPAHGIFSVDDAKEAGLWGKAGPWQQYKNRMLQMRARSYALRDAFADVLRGILTAEETRDIVYESTAHLEQPQAGASALLARLTQAPEPVVEPSGDNGEPEPAEPKRRGRPPKAEAAPAPEPEPPIEPDEPPNEANEMAAKIYAGLSARIGLCAELAELESLATEIAGAKANMHADDVRRLRAEYSAATKALKAAVPDAGPSAHEKIVIMLAERDGVDLETATTRLDRWSKPYSKSGFAGVVAAKLASAEALIKSGEISCVETEGT